MNKTEMQVRQALANYFGEKAKKLYTNKIICKDAKNQIREAVNMAAKNYMNYLSIASSSSTLPLLYINSVKKDMADSFIEEFTAENTGKTAGSMWNKGEAYYSKKLEKTVQELENSDDSNRNQKIDKLKEIYSVFLPYVLKRDELVSELVNEAQQSGIDSALSEYNMHKKIKYFFSTPEEYTESALSILKFGLEIIRVEKDLNNNPGREEEIHYRTMIAAAEKSAEIYKETVLKNETADIYRTEMVTA